MAEETSEVKKSEIAQKEEKILKFWQDNKIFEKTLTKEAPKGEFVFYDGPPFATGTPHYGHILASAIKDAIPRYKTMSGYHVPRRWGWDCHGLPIENIAEKDLKISGKKQIEEIGVKEFNEHARSKVLEYIGEWQKTVDRMGRWVDFEGSYKTMDNSYMESVWWAIKQFNDQGLLYEGTRVLPYCPRCETPIANSEIAMDNSYKDIKDISVTVEFELADEPGTFVLAWTTTPWTLPGNVALAINPGILYVEVEGEVSGNKYILAKSRVETVFKNNFKILREFVGQDLIGKKYKALFNYYVDDKKLENREKGWQIYSADFVTTEDGTGVVHIAPAFGEDDMALAKKEKLPIIWHVDGTGRFKPEVKDFAGDLVKPKDDLAGSPAGHLITDIKVVKYLEDHSLLFDQAKITHSYPHCFRCETPLYYYAIPAWFVDIQKVKADILNLNEQKITWIPEHLKRGRFHNSVESAPDWNISRNRYWATPLPIWKCQQCPEIKIIGSLENLADNQKKSDNKYWAMRHGEAESNVKNLISADPILEDKLTAKGKDEVKESAQKLKGEKINLIISSDFVRTKETAKIVAGELGLKSEQVIFDERLREINPGDFAGQTWKEYNTAFGSRANRINGHLSTGGENYNDIRRRVMAAIYEFDQKYQDQKILIISHGLPLFMFQATTQFLTDEGVAKAPRRGTDFTTGEARSINFFPVPHNDNFELDLHRPYIDEVKLICTCGGEMKRIIEVVDCWLESGSMPFAANNYPFREQKVFDPIKKVGFPAQFIAEYIAQTRTWFYYMLTVSAILFKETSFENVVTTGTVLAENGQKMSKHLNNFPDPWLMFDKYGVDALRLYLLSSPLMKAEDLNFSEKGVVDIGRRVVSRLLNVLSFYKMYVDGGVLEERPRAHLGTRLDNTANILDKWILARLSTTISQVTESLDHYEIDRSVWPVDDFIDDLSTWYLRRSRDRFKEGGKDRDEAIATIHFVLMATAKLLAPVAPFVAEMVYQELKTEVDSESVHLASWPNFSFPEAETLLADMQKVREIVSLGLEFRQATKIKVRQPLAELLIRDNYLENKEEYLGLIKDELNVKAVNFKSEIEDDVWLDTEITSDLQAEGAVRELIRQVQEMRKAEGLAPGEKINLVIEADNNSRELLRRFEAEFKLGTTTQKVDYAVVGESDTIWAGERPFKIKIIKL
ncbi:MAG: class I tRNA ligase family protein [Candidatus Paceibacterota bacterium]|jgi:isoleucyl-tRNA synthetase